jgi:hypothetical protein
LATHRSIRKEKLEAEIEDKETDSEERLAAFSKTPGSEFPLSAISVASQEYFGIILCATLPLPEGGLSEVKYRYRGFSRGHGGPFQNEETKRDRGELRKRRAVKAGGAAASVISMFRLGWLFPGSPPPASPVT